MFMEEIIDGQGFMMFMVVMTMSLDLRTHQPCVDTCRVYFSGNQGNRA